MKHPIRLALLLAVAVAAAPPRSMIGQSLPPPGAGLTLEQYAMLQERVDAFCLYLDTAVKEGKPIPDGDLAIPGAGDGYVYTAGEVKALVVHCDLLMRLMQRVVDATRR